jgi:hypothetical protein
LWFFADLFHDDNKNKILGCDFLSLNKVEF